MVDHEQELAGLIERSLRVHSFVPCEIDFLTCSAPIIAAWKRKTWNQNSGVVLLRLPNRKRSAGESAQELKWSIGKSIGYFPFFYALGLQIVFIGDGILDLASNLEEFVDKYDNQRVVLQSIHVVDVSAERAISSNT